LKMSRWASVSRMTRTRLRPWPQIMTDPYVGQLTFFRVYSGTVKTGDTIYNPIKGRKERLGRILQMHANQREEIKEVFAGDIAACRRSERGHHGETLCDPAHVITLERMVFPEPVIHVAVEPRPRSTRRRWGIALNRPGAGRPVFPRADRRRDPVRPIISGMGELHLEIWLIACAANSGVEANGRCTAGGLSRSRPQSVEAGKASSSNSRAAAASMVTVFRCKKYLAPEGCNRSTPCPARIRSQGSSLLPARRYCSWAPGRFAELCSCNISGVLSPQGTSLISMSISMSPSSCLYKEGRWTPATLLPVFVMRFNLFWRRLIDHIYLTVFLNHHRLPAASLCFVLSLKRSPTPSFKSPLFVVPWGCFRDKT